MPTSLDRTTVEDLYRRYAAQVERICRRILGNAEEAADVTHEVFVKLFTRGGDFQGRSEWMTWLHKVAVNECSSHLRKAGNRRRLLERHGDPVRPSAMFDPAALADRDTLRALLAREDDRTREMVLCRYLLDMGLREIGQVLRMSHTGVQQCLEKFEQRARKRLQKRTKVA